MAESTQPRASRSQAAWRAFRSRVEELGGTVVEGAWKGNGVPHEIRCRSGHTSYPYPGRVARGVGICRACGGNDPGAAWSAFCRRVVELGGEVLEPVWLGANKRHHVVCLDGHAGTIRPTHLQSGRGLCSTCAGHNPAVTEAKFRAMVAAHNGAVLGEYVDNRTPVLLRCFEGHQCSPRPDNVLVRQGSICRTCAGRDPQASWAAFRAEVERRGGTVLEPEWLGSDTPHRVRCKVGHAAAPSPGRVSQGSGICRFCAGGQWDVFYVVEDEAHGVIKFGITSGDARPRISAHARDGFDRVLRLRSDLPDGVAPKLERTILAALRDARENPVRGREYFPARVLALVLDLVDSHTGGQA